MAQFKWQLILLAFVFGQKYYAEARSTIKPRIINGSPAVAKQFPYQVYILAIGPESNGNRDTTSCGGVIISKRRVLTAAHCIMTNEWNYILYFGALNISNRQEKSRQQMRVTSRSIVVHPEYDSVEFFNDIALIKLPVDLEFNAYIQPAKLPDPSKSYDHENAIASGWGKTENGNGSDRLLYTDVTVLPLDECQSRYNKILESMICLKPSKTVICDGDSGGPLVIRNNDGSSTVIGLVSYGFGIICKIYSPDFLTRVSSFLPWIKQYE